MASSRRASIAAAAALVVAAGCGGSTEPDREPRLPAALASELAARSDRVAAALTRGDDCSAEARVRELQAATREALDAGAVPPPFRRPLRASVEDLAARIRCPPPAPPPAAEPGQGDDRDDEVDEGKGGGRGKDRGKGQEKGEGKGNDKGKGKDD